MKMRNQANKKLQQWLLLGIGLISLFFALIFWLINDIRPLKKDEGAVAGDAQPQFQAEKVAATPNLGVMTDEVRPLQQTTRVVASGNHDMEFRGTKFLLANQNNYSIELVRVTKEDIIRNFLDRQTNRHAFLYFRLALEHQPEHYVLNYGLFNSQQEAEDQLQRLSLKLPKSVHPKVVALKDYVPYVNDMGMDELSSNSTLYEVKLKPAPVPRIDELQQAMLDNLAAARAQANRQPTTSTTITQRDQAGNVVNVEESKSNISHPAASNPVVKTP